MLDLGRRRFLGRLGLAVAAPVIVRAASLMPVRASAEPLVPLTGIDMAELGYDWTAVACVVTLMPHDLMTDAVWIPPEVYRRLVEKITGGNALMARNIAGDRLALR